MHVADLTLSRTIAGALWVVVALVLIASWVTWFADQRQVAYMLGLTMVPLVGVAVVASLRLFAYRLAGLIRVVTGFDTDKELAYDVLTGKPHDQQRPRGLRIMR